MYILGLSYGYHDSSAALIKDGQVIFAALEERYSRVKHDYNFPINCINEALKYEGINLDAISYFIYYEDSLKKFNRIKKSILINFIRKKSFSILFELFQVSLQWVLNDKFDQLKFIENQLKVTKKKIKFCSHHESHAASCFFSSNFKKATIITIDGVGEMETLTISLGINNSIKKIKSFNYPNSIGLFYSTITAFLGFEINEGEYKVMGLAAFGKPSYVEKVRQIISFSNNNLKLDSTFFNFDDLLSPSYTKSFLDLFGLPVNLEKENPYKTINERFYYLADLACSFQKVLEEIILKLFDYAFSLTGEKLFCYSGGVALNAVANGTIIKKRKEFNLFIYPAAGDSGSSVGAALYYYFHILKNRRLIFPLNIYLGSKYSKEQIKKSLNDFNLKNYLEYKDPLELCEVISKKILNNKVIGWFNGRSEFGPRALGSRSILANPSDKNMKDIINKKIKFREEFRPFAPMIITEKANEYFDIEKPIDLFQPENFMLTVVDAKIKFADKIFSALNVNNTARVQLVSKVLDENFLDIKLLLRTFYKNSDIPVLINTSFNRRGEPIVETPYDAIKVFLYTDIDTLVLENFVISK